MSNYRFLPRILFALHPTWLNFTCAALDTPSYVSVSVAAFGYSGYGRTSLSSGNLHSTRLEKPKGLPVPVRSVPHSSSSHNGDLPAAFNPTANLPENQTVVSQRSREELQRSPLHVDVTESTNENVQSSVGVQNGILESKLNGYNTTNERPIESPRLPIRPNSRVSYFVCSEWFDKWLFSVPLMQFSLYEIFSLELKRTVLFNLCGVLSGDSSFQHPRISHPMGSKGENW